MNRPYRYETDCTRSDGDSINRMREGAKPVSLSTVLRYCDGVRAWAKKLGYGRDTGLTLERDWHLSFHKSVYRGLPCYYIVHSAIEHIWVLR